MKTNQQELDLGYTKKGQRRGIKVTNKNWVEFLNYAKENLNGFNKITLTKICSEYRVPNQWQTFLIKNNIVYKNYIGYWEWDNKIPVSNALIVKFRTYSSETNKQINLVAKNRKEKQLEPISAKPVILKGEIVKEKYTKTKTKEIGLIRKFLKWIY
jgi:hypothetical protein